MWVARNLMGGCAAVRPVLKKMPQVLWIRLRRRVDNHLFYRPRYDHILKWELFQLADLDTYQGMLKLLFMKELERIVKLYEAYRQALLTELEHRKQRQQWYAQQHGKNF